MTHLVRHIKYWLSGCLIAVGLTMFSSAAQGQVIDFYNLDASYVKCEIGPFAARTGGANWIVQKVDSGPDQIASRHTIHRGRDDIDPRTIVLNGTDTVACLHTVPEGEVKSVRLGNWLDGRVTGDANENGQAERITYTFTVTDSTKYILLRYAIIWENPHNHNDIVPSFQLETFQHEGGNTSSILGLCFNFVRDAVSTAIDYSDTWLTLCRICAYQRFGTSQGNYYYYSNNSNQYNYGRVQGNYYNGDNTTTTYYYGSRVEECPQFTWRHEDQPVAWRDWRTRLINLEDYVGKTVSLRITSSDCGYVEHWGYSYFTLRCLPPTIYSPTCGAPTDQRTFVAPTGQEDTIPGFQFKYIWYDLSDPANPKELEEKSNKLTVYNDGTPYECYIASPENGNCYISLYAKPEPWSPIANFNTRKNYPPSCVDTVYIEDLSGMSNNGSTPVVPHVDVSYVEFDFGNGKDPVRYSPGANINPVIYEQDGTYTITQTAHYTANGHCTHTISKTVTVRGSDTKHEADIYDTICAGAPYPTWNGIEVNKQHSQTYTFVTEADNHYCDSTVRLHLHVKDKFYYSQDIDVLEGKETPYIWHGHTYNGEERKFYTTDVYWDSLTNPHTGCDSVYRLELRVHPRYIFPPTYDTICCGKDFLYGGRTYNFSTAKDTILFDSAKTTYWLNDSIHSVYLHIKPTYHFYDTEYFCKGSVYHYHGQSFTEPNDYEVRFRTSEGCDSIYYLRLIEKQVPHTIIDSSVTILPDQSINWRGINCQTSGSYYDTLPAANGCDSIVQLRLNVKYRYFFIDEPVTICQGEHYNFHGTPISTNGTHTKTFPSQYGTDSTFQITLTVKPKYDTPLHVDRLEGQVYDFYGTKLDSGGVYTYTFPPNFRRCDSTITLELEFHPKYFFPESDTICEGEAYRFHRDGADVYCTKTGTYWDSCKTVFGYDSIYRLDLFVAPKDTSHQKLTICAPASYDFFGNTCDTTGVYYKTLTSRFGCDSVIELKLTVNPYYNINIDSTICEGGSVYFAGETRDSSGVYTQAYKTQNGCNCDSVVTLNLRVTPKARVHDYKHLCTGESFIWHGESITTNRVVSDTTPVNGCDSIHFWHIYAHDAILDTVRISICQGKSYTFHGHTYTPDHAGVDTITLGGHSVNDCDSLHTLILTTNPTYHNQHVYDTICTGGFATFNSKDYYRGDTYYDTLLTENNCNCDSAFIIHIKEYPPYFTSSTMYLCEDSSFTWHGKLISGPGTYYDSLTSTRSHNRCDSVYELIVKNQPPVRETVTATILSTQTFSFKGQSLSVAGDYYDTLKSYRTGCDSIVKLVLTVRQVYDTLIYDTICRGTPYEFNHKPLENTGLYTEKFISKIGTDSTVHLNLVVWEPRIRSFVAHITDQQLPYTWHLPNPDRDIECTHGGVYDDSCTSLITGCDSINRLQLVVHPTTRLEEDTAICKGKRYFWHNEFRDSTDDYYDTLKNVIWPTLDSIYYHLALTVNPTYRHDTAVSICENGVYDFHGTPITTGGPHTKNIPTENCGCDSIFNVQVTVRRPITEMTREVICQPNSFEWFGKSYSATGIYTDTLKTIDGECDSVYRTLDLTVKTRHFTTLPEATICDNRPYIFCGKPINTPGDYDTTLTASNGCDSIVRVHLNVNPTYYNQHVYDTICTGGYVTINHKIYSSGDTYYDTLKTKNCGCDSAIIIHITEVPLFFRSDTVSLCKDSTMTWHGRLIDHAATYYDSLKSNASNGKCDSIYELVVLRQDPDYEVVLKTIWSNNPYFFNGELRDTTGIYFDTVPSGGNKCNKIIELRLTVLPVYDVTVSDTICRGETYSFYGTDLVDGGPYTKTIPSSIGTDSTINLSLLVWEPRFNTQMVHITDQQLPYTWHLPNPDRNIECTHGGVYDDSLKRAAVTGCDSINRLQLVVHPTTRFEEEAAICAERSYFWHNQSCKTTGHYYDTLKNVRWPQLDSIYYHLHLTVNDIYRTSDTIALCEGAHYLFNKHKDISTAGTYYDTLKTTCGCDSSFILEVKVRSTQTIPTYVSLCPSELPYIWHTWRDSICDHGDNYRDTLRTKDGLCDSIYYTLSLTVKPVPITVLPDVTICDNQWFNFCGKPINTPGDHDTTLTSIQTGCDSIVRVHLNVNPTYTRDTTFILCTGSTVEFNYKSYTRGGPYRDTLYTKNGCNCDSVYNITIKEVHPFYHKEIISLCKDSTMEWHGLTIDHADTYYDRRKSKQSEYLCDSIYELVVQEQQPKRETIYAEILSTQKYQFGDSLYSTIGTHTYYDTLPAVTGACDSIVTLVLTVKPVYNVSLSATICRGEEYPFNTRTLTEPGIYKDTLLSTVYNTDSIVSLTLAVHNPKLTSSDVHIFDTDTPYVWTLRNGTVTRSLSRTGVYSDTIYGGVAATGCDSVSRLNLYVHKTYAFHESKSTCKGTPYTWRGNEYYDEGDYKDEYQTSAWGADSIYHLHLTLDSVYLYDTTVYICAGSDYLWQDTVLSTANTYEKHYQTHTPNRCDSIYRITVHLRHTRTEFYSDYICRGETYPWRGKEYDKRGIYVDTVRTKDSLCDSIYYTLDLRVKDTYERHENVSICAGDYYEFDGKLFDKDTVYTVRTTASNQCDSIVHLHLKVNPTYNFDIYDTICEGGARFFDNIERQQAGVYTYTGKTKANCDSVVRLHLAVIAKQTAYIERHLCLGDTIEIGGEKVTTGGTYTVHSTSQRGCDSTAIWRVITHRPLRDTTYAAICKGKEYIFHGIRYREAGKYSLEDHDRYGCDSTYVLILTVNPVYQRDTTLDICENEYFMYNGHRYDVGGYYKDTARTKNGCDCDSILNITLSKYPVTVIPMQHEMCHGDAYTWHNRTLTKGGIYDDTIKMKHRTCDSIIYRLTLKINSSSYNESSTAICDNASYLWRGSTYTEAGVYYDSLINSGTGCDSVFCLKLSVNPTYRSVESVMRCDIEPYWYEGKWLTQSGVFTNTLQSSCGCDSAEVLSLTVTSTRRDTQRVAICEGHSYLFEGRELTKSGLYYDTINIPESRQCAITVLDLGYQKPTVVSNATIEDICADDKIWNMRTRFTGTRPSAYTLLFDDNARAAGFVNVINQPFDDNLSGPVPRKENEDYVRPDYYTAELILDNDLCASGQAKYTIRFVVRYPSWIIEQNWNDVVSLLNENYNGGYIFTGYDWYVNGNKIDDHRSYIYLPQILNIGDEVYVAPTRRGEDYPVPSCPITIFDMTPFYTSEYPVIVYATSVPGRFRLQAFADGSYTFYSATGVRITSGSFRDGDHRYIDTHVPAGCYLIRLDTPEHGTKTVKLFLP